MFSRLGNLPTSYSLISQKSESPQRPAVAVIHSSPARFCQLYPPLVTGCSVTTHDCVPVLVAAPATLILLKFVYLAKTVD